MLPRRTRRRPRLVAAAALVAGLAGGLLSGQAGVRAQQAPTPEEIAGYKGLHSVAAAGDVNAIRKLAPELKDGRKADGAVLNARDRWGRTPLMVAVHMHRPKAVAALIKAGADLNALDRQKYDAVTIAAVAGHGGILNLLLRAGAKPDQITSPYDGTALIAAAHKGNVEEVSLLIAAGAPLDHINKLGWTALTEAIVLGDGSDKFVAVVEALVKGGANVNIGDRKGRKPLALAQARGYTKMAAILKKAGAKP